MYMCRYMRVYACAYMCMSMYIYRCISVYMHVCAHAAQYSCIYLMYITNLHLERYRHESESNLGTSHYKPQGHQGPRKSKEGFETPGVTNQSV